MSQIHLSSQTRSISNSFLLSPLVAQRPVEPSITRPLSCWRTSSSASRLFEPDGVEGGDVSGESTIGPAFSACNWLCCLNRS